MSNRILRRLAVTAAVLAVGAGAVVWAQPAKPPAIPAGPPGAGGSPAAPPLTELKIVEQVNARCDKALAYLASKQDAKGFWVPNNQAPNALAVLAFLGRGNVPGRGPYRDVLERAKQWLVANTRPDGFAGFGTMYEHGMATLAMAEMYGMDPDPKLEDALRRAVTLIIKCQAPNGGWRYAPTPGDHDLSVTVMQIVALRAANNAEIPVPQAVIDKAASYVRACYNPADANRGGYAYQPGGGPGPHTTAAGTLSLQLLGQYDDPTIVGGTLKDGRKVPGALAYLASMPAEWGNGGGISYFYYYHYYAIQANYQAGGKQWNEWHPKVRELLLSKQNTDGSWDVPAGSAENEGVVGPNKVYWTAMSCVILDIYSHFLPAYQR